jgi:hypothetical protein|tara:strand:+ start:216 stop:650 length:435 start_codon:yes stop_codon:yes gene_type:complete
MENNTVVLKDVTVVNSRLVTPVERSFGSQFSMLVKGNKNLDKVSTSEPTEEGAFWLNTNGETPQGVKLPPPVVVTKDGAKVTEELGSGSKVNLKFAVVHIGDKVYYNLKTVGVVSVEPLFDHFSGLFDEPETPAVASNGSEPWF